MMRRCVVAVAMSWATPAGADSPMPPPADERNCASNGRYCAESSVEKQETVVYEQCGDGERIELWSIDRWLSSPQPSRDGRRVMVSGSNLIGWRGSEEDEELGPAPGTLGASAFIVYGASGVVAKVPVSAVVERPEDLIPTVSHYYWGTSFLDERDVVVVRVEACERKQACPVESYFDVRDGQRLTPEQARGRETPLPPTRCGATTSSGCMNRCSVQRAAPSPGLIAWCVALLFVARRRRRGRGVLSRAASSVAGGRATD